VVHWNNGRRNRFRLRRKSNRCLREEPGPLKPEQKEYLVDDGKKEGGMSSTILIIDDNPTHLKLVSKLLEGHKILRAVNAEEAQVVLAETLPELILMDVALPGMDGLTLARQLKADKRTRHIRIVALTAFAMKGHDQKAFDAGCDGYITQPIDTRKLPERVAELHGPPVSRFYQNQESPTSRHGTDRGYISDERGYRA
jgi:CheY-like chemotaxis protein